MSKKVVITVGGTGGHVYPAIALARQLIHEDPSIQLLFIGGGLSQNRYFDQKTFSFLEIACSTLSKNQLRRFFQGIGKISKGLWQSYRYLKKFKPHLVVGFGSYHTLPLLAATKLSGIPMILHEQNSVPGKVNRFFSRSAVTTGVYFPQSAQFFKGRTEIVGMPLREGYQNLNLSKSAAKSLYQLDPQRLTLLVFGGSQGAQSVNTLFSESIRFLPTEITQGIQILHFTGETANLEEIQKRYHDQGILAVVKTFEPQMDLAWRAADLMISRAGAGTIAEALAFEVPGILIPYPHAMDNHQEKNADFMVDTVKGAIKLSEKGLSPSQLAHVIVSLLDGDCVKLNEMHAALSQYKKVTPTRDLCAVVREFLKKT